MHGQQNIKIPNGIFLDTVHLQQIILFAIFCVHYLYIMCTVYKIREVNNESMNYRVLSRATMINLLTKVAIIVGRSVRIVCFCSIITKFEITQRVLVKLGNKKLQENPSSISQVLLCERSGGQPNGRRDITKLRVAFRKFGAVNIFLYVFCIKYFPQNICTLRRKGIPVQIQIFAFKNFSRH